MTTKHPEKLEDNAPSEATLFSELEDNVPVLYVEVEGKRIVKRYSGENWISLEPGYTVRGNEPGNYGTLTVEFDPAKAEIQ
jgi:hypothetical protein